MKFARTIADPYSKRATDRAATIIIVIVAYPEWLASHLGRDSPAEAGAGLDSCAHVGTHSSAAGGTLLLVFRGRPRRLGVGGASGSAGGCSGECAAAASADGTGMAPAATWPAWWRPRN